MAKIVVGLSGGVDSSVAAHLLLHEGHEVIGCTMRTFDTERSLREAADAEEVARKLGIPYVQIDYREAFQRDVITYFMSEYMHGRTPNPCCVCNRKVKWQALLACMREQGADFVATGHYARIAACPAADGGVRYAVQKAENVAKDQSYALYNLTQEELSHTVMPLGAYTKDEVRKLAEEAGLFTARKPDSQEICFIPDHDYARFIEEHLELLSEALRAQSSGLSWDRPGSFVDASGRKLGTHQGIIHYTIGQRKGLGIALGKRIFVQEIRPLTNEVVLADNEDVFTEALICEDVNFQAVDFETESEKHPEAELQAIVKIRYGDKGTAARIRRLPAADAKKLCAPEQPENGEGEEMTEIPAAAETKAPSADTALYGGTSGSLRYEVRFETPVRAATPGQAAVFYDGENRMLGGGSIVAAVR